VAGGATTLHSVIMTTYAALLYTDYFYLVFFLALSIIVLFRYTFNEHLKSSSYVVVL